MRKIRFGTFETNSSMVHAISIVEGELLERWKAGEALLRLHGVEDDPEEVVATERDLDDTPVTEDYGLHPEKPYYSHEELFPYKMFSDDGIAEEWEAYGGVFWTAMEDTEDGVKIEALYMG